MNIKFQNSFINITNENEYLNSIISSLNSEQINTFFYLNSYSFYLADKDKEFKKALNNADFVIADGYSVVLITKLLYKIKIEKVVFTYLFFDKISTLLEGKKIFLLGGTQNVIDKAYEKLKNKYKLSIVGNSNGYFNDSEKIINCINSSRADILICGMGMPKSEIWIQNNISALRLKCVFSVGGFFNFLVNDKKQAPNIFYNSGFEWIYRLIQEPKRLFKRYLIANTYFIFQLVKAIFTHKENKRSL